jgi:SAM-dependent methyltransferase
MPTVPPAGPHRSGVEPHRHRQVAESFGTDPERYDRSRPRYPDALVGRIVSADPGLTVVDVGCGTGIAARQLQAAGCTVLGVEPDARMAEWARLHGLDVEVSTFEAWDPGGRAFDAVVAGQAWHWVDPVAGAAKAAEVLRPGGRLAVFWNAHQPPPELADAFVTVYRRLVTDSLPVGGWTIASSEAYSMMCATAADGIRAAGGFGAPQQWACDWQRSYTRDEWLDQVPTHGGHSQLPPATVAEVLAGIGAAIDAVGGSFPMRYTTMAVIAVRNGVDCGPDPGGDEYRETCADAESDGMPDAGEGGYE